MSGSTTYDELLKQVENLRAENTTLRQELHDNSSQLTQLESDASHMKDGLNHLQHSILPVHNNDQTDTQSIISDEERSLSRNSTHSGASDIQLRRIQDYSSRDRSSPNSIHSLDQNSNERDDTNIDSNTDHNWTASTTTQWQQTQNENEPLTAHNTDVDGNTQHGLNTHQTNTYPSNTHLHTNSTFTSTTSLTSNHSDSSILEKKSCIGTTSTVKRNADQDGHDYLQQLDQQRTAILQDVENEEKQRKWFYDQLDSLAKRLDDIPTNEKLGVQGGMNRQQLEGETTTIRQMMYDNLGTSAQIAQRHHARMQRVREIETEMLLLQQRHKQQLESEKRDSGTCDHIETDNDGIIVVDAATNTTVSGDSFVSTENRLLLDSEVQQNASFHENSVRISSVNGSTDAVVNLSQTTAEVALVEAERLARAGSRQVQTATHIPVSTNTTDRVTEQSPPRLGAGADAPQLHDGHKLASLYHGAWPLQQENSVSDISLTGLLNQESSSVHSFYSSAQSTQDSQIPIKPVTNQQLSTKVEMVYSLLSMLGTNNKDDMSKTLLAMSSSQDSCISMRRSGCLPLLIQLLHGNEQDTGLLGNTRGNQAARARASAALHNIVHSHPDDKRGRREARVLRLLEQIRAHCDQIRQLSKEQSSDAEGQQSNDLDHHPGPAIAALMKLSFDEEHRHAICTLGGLQAIAELLQVDHDVNAQTTEQYNLTMRRYACMALTNLTFGDGTNKALLCSMHSCMCALVAQLRSHNEDLRQVAASVLRNLSWRADLASKKTLRSIEAVPALTMAAMAVSKESTLKSVLSALWNLSAHCSENKADICAVQGALAFLVSSLTFRSPSKTLAVIENGGGILRNISSHVAVREDYRRILREHNCLNILLKHLRSPSLTIVSNACGTLWNLSARCLQDQHSLWEMGAVAMLRNLVHSKHKMISMGSAAALKNLLTAGPPSNAISRLDASGLLRGSNTPGLHVRKQRALEAEIDQSLSETCDNVDSPQNSPTEVRRVTNKIEGASQQKYRQNGPRYVFTTDDLTNSRGNCNIYELASANGQSIGRALPFGRNYISAGGANLLDGHVQSPSHNVSRSGSQDSIGSVHSDISHDRHRVYNILARTNKLIHSNSALDSQSNAATNQPEMVDNASMLHPVLLSDNSSAAGSTIKGQASTVPVHSNQNTQNVIAAYKEQIKQNETSQDEPIDYSTKYTDSNTCYQKPIPKVGNYVGNLYKGNQGTTFMSHQTSRDDCDEKPTNFGVLYSEREVNDAGDYNDEESPINYSNRYQETETIPNKSYAQSTQEYNQPPDLEEGDTVKTFCTEDTPLNFLSTATSMSDLRDKDKDIQDNDSSNNKMHSNASQANIQNNNVIMIVPNNASANNLTTINPYDDEGVSSPCGDEPKTYCEEGTPQCFSRVSSLSSLHSSDVASTHSSASSNTGNNSANVTAISNRNNDTLVLQSIDENCSLEISQNDSVVAEKTLSEINVSRSEHNDSFQSRTSNTTTSTATSKSVTFDESSQQQTPMMFSRCSSLGSLSSFDAHSVHSSVVSEYSRRASEVVSPSDLPDSPSDTMPPSPRQKSPKYNHNDTVMTENSDAHEITQIENPMHDSTFVDQTQNFGITHDETNANEKDLFSCGTSLSALTFDDEDHVKIEKETDLGRLPLGHAECTMQPSLNTHEDENEWDDLDDSDNDSHGAVMLEECIKQAMPKSKPKNKAKHTPSDTHAKKTASALPIPQIHSTSYNHTPQRICPVKPAMSQNNLPQTPRNIYPIGASMDTTKTYQTEGTPINFSNAGSFSDLSSLGCADGAEAKTPPKRTTHLSLPGSGSSGVSDNRSDISSLSGDCDDLLTEAIEAGMPKSSSKSVKSKNKGLVNHNPIRYPFQSLPRNKPSVSVSLFNKPQINSQVNIQPVQAQNEQSGDTCKSYAEEGTPLNFSRATSLSDITDLHQNTADDTPPVSDICNESLPCDSPHSYNIEGTPVSFSRNDSLSSLSCDEDADPGTPRHIMLRAKSSSGKGRGMSPSVSGGAMKSNKPVQSAFARVKGIHSRRVLQYSTPKHDNIPSSLTCGMAEDDIVKYDIEGTPANFSANSSLSSLNSSNEPNDSSGDFLNDTVIANNIHANHEEQSGDLRYPQDHPSLSCNSSLSSLSIDSLNMEASDSVLLNECINLGMPKSKKQTKKQTSYTKHSPSQTTGNHGHEQLNKSVKERQNSEIKSPTIFSKDIESVVAAIEESERDAPNSSDEEHVIKAIENISLNDKTDKERIMSKEETEATKENQMIMSGVSDIMKESFPDMGHSLISSLSSTTDQENVLQTEESGRPSSVNNLEPSTFDDGDDAFFLKEAQIIVNELKNTRHLADSTVSEDLFIDRLSLVSMDDASDVEATISYPCVPSGEDSIVPDVVTQGQSISTETSDSENSYNKSMINLTYKQNTQNVEETRSNQTDNPLNRPRILKPGDQSNLKKETTEVKAVRGKRKLLYSSANRAPTNKTQSTTPIKKVIKSTTKSSGKKSNDSTPQKSTPPKASLPSTPSNTTPPKKPLSKAVTKSSTTTNRTPATTPKPRNTSIGTRDLDNKNKSKTSPRSQNNRSLTPIRNNGSRNNSPSGRLPDQNRTTSAKVNAIKPNNSKVTNKTSKPITTERPKGPRKQGTFTKDSPSHNAPEITSDVEVNPDTENKTNSAKNVKKDKPMETEDRFKNIRGRTIMSKTKSNNAPHVEPSGIPQTSGVVKRRSSRSPSSTSLNTSNSNSNRSSIGSSQSSLNSKSSRSSAVSPISRLPKNNSSKMTSPVDGSSMATTTKITGRKNSEDSTGGGTSIPQKSSVKKPVKSKIATLWKKEDKGKPTLKKDTKNIASTKDTTKSLKSMFRSSAKHGSKNKEESDMSKLIGITRSSTYDKIDVKKEEEETDGQENISSDTNNGANEEDKKIWRKTYTIHNDNITVQTTGAWQHEEKLAEKEEKTKPKKSSLWRRGNKSNKSDGESGIPKKGIWRKQKAAKVTSPQDPGEVVSTEESGVWMKRGDDKSESTPTSNAAQVTTKPPPASNTAQVTTKPPPASNVAQVTTKPLPASNAPQVTTKPPPLSPTQISTPNAAIVAPFNYKPLPSSAAEATTNNIVLQKAQTLPAHITIPTEHELSLMENRTPLTSTPSIHSLDSTPITKTEMLMARRRKSYMMSARADEVENSQQQTSTNPTDDSSCLITTV